MRIPEIDRMLSQINAGNAEEIDVQDILSLIDYIDFLSLELQKRTH